MKVLITGAGGQLGRALVATAPVGVQAVAADRATLDIADEREVRARLAELKPALVINAAAYTAVDKAEAERESAFRINRDGAAHLAEAARRCGARLIHISTDYVFDGAKSTPYAPDDAPNPLNVYGASKLAGENAVRSVMPQCLIVRTAWVYANSGHNFLRTMLRLLAERDAVRVVCDQIGTPTHAGGLARALWSLAGAEADGILHWTDAGVASWYDFAVAIAARAHPSKTVQPIRSHEFPTAARRPACVVLDKSAAWRITGVARHWQQELAQAMGGVP